ncbi:MAG TPA: hypothetical protein VNK23_03445 [Candidatus Dormibacteraeota bacterium]|nr:hypothetical protein [Candidatus Dormibacteraeota bacterium]
MFPRRKTLSTSARRTVSDDWITVLPRDKSELFDIVVSRWECAYAMMSVALDDALSLRSRGELVCARQQVAVSADLLQVLAASLATLCTTLQQRARSISDLPAVRPLNSQFFRGNKAQNAASWNGLIHHVLFRGRSRFFHKLRILSEMLADLDQEFREAAGDIAKGMDTQPIASWLTLDDLHYDFNTCLRETEVVLKSFLRALPSEQLPGLARDLDAVPSAKPLRAKPRLSGATA